MYWTYGLVRELMIAVLAPVGLIDGLSCCLLVSHGLKP